MTQQLSLFDYEYTGVNYICIHASNQLSSVYIGWTEHRRQRAAAHLRVNRVMLAWWPGSEDTERSLHRQLARYADPAIGRYWFRMTRPSVDILSELVELHARFGHLGVADGLGDERAVLLTLDDMAMRYDYRAQDRQPIVTPTEWGFAADAAEPIRKESTRNPKRKSRGNPHGLQ